MPIFYKLKHKPTGLFYTPSKYRTGTFSLSGKIYHRKPSPKQIVTNRLPWSFVYKFNSGKGEIYKKLKGWIPELEGKKKNYIPVNEDDWEVVEYKIEVAGK